jgi:hypothetical protein
MSRTRCLRYWIYDLLITHDRFGSSSDPSLNGNLHYPNNIDRSLNEDADDKIRKYHHHLYLLLSERLGGYIVNLSDLYFYMLIGKLTAFLKPREFSLLNMIKLLV